MSEQGCRPHGLIFCTQCTEREQRYLLAGKYDNLRRTLEIIAGGDSKDPRQDAADALHEVGEWRTNVLPSVGSVAAPQPVLPRSDWQKVRDDLTRAENLLVRVYSEHPETRGLIEQHTGPWFTWGVDRRAG